MTAATRRKPPQSDMRPGAYPIDAHVGFRLRLRRELLGISEAELAPLLGLDVSTLKRFEAGAERIEASALFAFAARLEVPITWFYDGLSEETGLAATRAKHEDDVVPALPPPSRRDDLALVATYYEMLDASNRRKLVDIARILAGADAPALRRTRL